MLVMWSQAIWEKNNKNVGLVNLNKYRIYLSSLHPPKKKSGQDEKRREKLPGNKKVDSNRSDEKKGKYNLI